MVYTSINTDEGVKKTCYDRHIEGSKTVRLLTLNQLNDEISQ
jgi:hypothetical protein